MLTNTYRVSNEDESKRFNDGSEWVMLMSVLCEVQRRLLADQGWYQALSWA
jgi:hypothetical protein